MHDSNGRTIGAVTVLVSRQREAFRFPLVPLWKGYVGLLQLTSLRLQTLISQTLQIKGEIQV